MTIIQCDICGKQLPFPPKDSEQGHFAIDAPYGHFDLCAACWDWGRSRDLNDIYLSALRAAWVADHPPDPVPEPSPPEVPPGPDPAPEAQEPASSIKGRYAPLKRAVLEALEKYRKENGAGCLQGLADEACVTVEEIAGIRLKRKVPITVYESLAWVLNIREKGADA